MKRDINDLFTLARMMEERPIDRVLRLAAAKGLNQTELATEMGTTSAALSNWKTRGMPADKYQAAADALGVTVDKILGRCVERPEPVEVDLDTHPDLERVRRVKLRLQAGVNGFGLDADESDGTPIFFRSDWLRQRGYKPYDLVALKVMGQSMEPSLYPDDLVVVNTADREPKDGKVFAINYEGEAVIKRMVRDGGTWWLASDNPDQRRFPRKECTGDACIIVGQVIHRQSEQI